MEAINIEKFSAVITNMANVMKAAWHIIEEKHPNIVCFRCASYTLNLLIKDILKIHDIKTVIDNATKLVKYFKSHPQALAKLKRIQSDNYKKEIALVLPAITRWGTHLECLQSLQKSKVAIEQTLMDSRIRETIDASLRIYVLCDEFWEDLDLIASILQPIVTTLKLFESDSATLSSIYSNFRKMLNTIQDISCNFFDEIQTCIEERWNYIYHVIMMVAYMLDPRFLEESRTYNIEAIGYNTFTVFTKQKFGQEKSVELFIEIVKFRNKSSPYDDFIIWELNPGIFLLVKLYCFYKLLICI